MHRYLESFILTVLKLINRQAICNWQGRERKKYILTLLENQELIESIKYLIVYPTLQKYKFVMFKFQWSREFINTVLNLRQG